MGTDVKKEEFGMAGTYSSEVFSVFLPIDLSQLSSLSISDNAVVGAQLTNVVDIKNGWGLDYGFRQSKNKV